jgi:acylphosphatase
VAPESTGAFRATVKGRVQGVGFRYSAVREARRLGINGSVSNSGDGNVEVVAEGQRDSLERLLQWLHSGPPGAHVSEVEIQWLPFTGDYDGFDVEF